LQPREHLLGITVRRENRVEDVLDPGVADYQRVAPVEGQALVGERRQAQGCRQLEALVAQDRERQLKTLDHLALVGAVLGRESENSHAGGLELAVVIAIGARLGRATAGAGSPIGGNVDPGRWSQAPSSIGTGRSAGSD
jgi:hypothetical protein